MSGHGIFRTMDDALYRQWVNEFDTITNDGIECRKQKINSLSIKPKIEIVPIATGVTAKQIEIFKSKFKDQVYQNWSIHISKISGPIDQQSRNAAKILTSNPIIEAAENADFVLPLPLDALLPPQALATFIFGLANLPGADILYADEDRLQKGKRTQPRFKTDWDPFFILGCSAIGTPVLYRSEVIRRSNLQGLTSRTVDNLLHAVILRVSASTQDMRILHIPFVLCHRTESSDWIGSEAREIVLAHLADHNHGADIFPAPLSPNWNRIRFHLPDPPPLVSIIIPTRDHADLLRCCTAGILNHTDYPSIELIIVDNGTIEPEARAVLTSLMNDDRVRVLLDDGAFNYSRLNNKAAKLALGDVLVLLNDDVEIINPDWLKELVSLASCPNVGAVGAKLLYPDLRIQHAGVSFGPDKLIVHQMRLARRDETGPNGELALLRSVSAVTAACMALRRSLYLDVGGLDETHLKVAYNDIDLCRRIAKKGLAIVWTPFAELVHHECASRGKSVYPERAEREASESAAFWAMNPEFYDSPDPFHNPQLEFGNDGVDFARPPRWHPLREMFTEEKIAAFLY